MTLNSGAHLGSIALDGSFWVPKLTGASWDFHKTRNFEILFSNLSFNSQVSMLIEISIDQYKTQFISHPVNLKFWDPKSFPIVMSGRISNVLMAAETKLISLIPCNLAQTIPVTP